MKRLCAAFVAVLAFAVGCNRLSFVPGTYPAEAEGYGGKITAEVTFSADSLKSVNVISHNETPYIGGNAIEPSISKMIAANGTGMDAVTGATYTFNGIRDLVNNAAAQAGVSNIKKFKHNKIAVKPQKDVEDSWDIVVIGGGGAGLFAAAQAAEDGNTVLVIEKNAELGGNTIVSGGMFQAVDHNLVWAINDPESTVGTTFDGRKVERVKSTVGCIDLLKTILEWNEEPFDAAYYEEHEFVAGDVADQARHGVHREYLQTLLKLKSEIRKYLAYAEPKLAAGMKENELTLFSTTDLHIFQTYYGGLRQSADKTEWIYPDYDLLIQLISEGEKLKPWLIGMGVDFEDNQVTLPGAMWYRENRMTGSWADSDCDGVKEYHQGKWGAYIMAPVSRMLNADKHNRIMKSTTAKDLIVKDGRIIGVNAVMDDGTKVIAYASKGVIVATGGYAANVRKVIETNRYWSADYLTDKIGTTNRASLVGEGIDMAVKAGAGEVGEGWTQLLPLAYAADGLIATGSIENAVFISPVTGRRFVDECSERDVLALEAFRNGIEYNGARGVFLYITGNLGTDRAGLHPFIEDTPGKEWCRKGSELAGFFKEIGLDTDAGQVLATIREYDSAASENRQPEDIRKQHQVGLIGFAEQNPDGSYDMSTYDIDNTPLRIRLLAPSRHHTMGGLRVDIGRHVLDKDGQPIPGLYAAGEVTGGFFGGNRLGGNALTEIMVSGRIAARIAGRQ